MTYRPDQQWFGGLTCDHLFADCPNRTRVLEGPNRIDREWCEIDGMGIDVDDESVCGMCRHRLKRKANS